MTPEEKEAWIDLANAQEAAWIRFRMNIGDKPAVTHTTQIMDSKDVAVNETVFTQLKFEAQHSESLGDYEASYVTDNPAHPFADAYSILKNANAKINARYRGADYTFSYWVYGEGKIYRQKLKEAPK